MSMLSGGLSAVPRQPRLSDRVADGIIEKILSEGLQPGDALPAERDLGEQFGVSRTVIREAVRALDAKGLLEVRSGSRIKITAVDPKTVRESLRHFVRGSIVDYSKVTEVRGALEVAAAGLAATRAGAEQIEQLWAALTQMTEAADGGGSSAQADNAFHRALASATGNELFVLLYDALGDALADMPKHLTAGGGEHELVLTTHRRILDSIAGHDPDAARSAMRELLGHGGTPPDVD